MFRNNFPHFSFWLSHFKFPKQFIQNNSFKTILGIVCLFTGQKTRGNSLSEHSIQYKNTYVTRLITALLMPTKSKSLKFKLMAIGLCPPCKMSMRLIRNGSNGGIDKP